MQDIYVDDVGKGVALVLIHGFLVLQICRNHKLNVLKLICYRTSPIGNIPRRFETIDKSRKNYKINGLELKVIR